MLVEADAKTSGILFRARPLPIQYPIIPEIIATTNREHINTQIAIPVSVMGVELVKAIGEEEFLSIMFTHPFAVVISHIFHGNWITRIFCR